MARKIKFALEMADGTKVRGDLAELREHFDLESAVRYFLSGKLVEWLDDRYYEDEADALEQIDKDAPDFHQKLCEALGVEYEAEDDLDVAALERLNEKKAILRQRTDDEEIIKNADKTALTQEDLADLLDMGETTIYLCGEKFTIPVRVKGISYIGILGAPLIDTKFKNMDEFKEKGIVLKNVVLPGGEPTTTDEKISESPESGANSYYWGVPKEQMEQLFESIFGNAMEHEVDYYRANENIFGRWLDAITFNDENKFTAIGHRNSKKKGKAEEEKTFSDEQKTLALAVVCNNQYSEDEIIHLRIQEDFVHGWAFTRDAFCATYEDDHILIPYKELKFITEKRTKYISDGSGNKWKFTTNQKCYIHPLRTGVGVLGSLNRFNEVDALYQYLITVSRMF